ncbi:endolytic transglycosylase MltG [Gordonia sp. (in: high G+C Gram-positive bacteria)]|uniref:endolytic transglycosylase MltG n=1 Tax=Gordonia sp. (in: high G+C Gram-positive bacteria) TaxID=84139 RepID=UPI003529B8A5
MPDAAKDEARVTEEQEPRTRHRRRRAPGDPTTTGSIPIVRTDPGLPDPTVEYRRPERSANPYLEIRYSQAEVPSPAIEKRFVEPSWSAEPPQVRHRAAVPPTPLPEPAAPVAPVTAPVPEAPTVPAAPAPVPAPEADADTAAMPSSRAGSPADFTATDPHVPALDPAELNTAAFAPAAPTVPVAAHAAPVTGSFDILDGHAEAAPAPAPSAGGSGEPPTGDLPVVEGGMPERRSHRKALFAVLAVAIVVLVVGLLGLKHLGVFDSHKNFSSTTGGSPTLVQIPEQASVREIGKILADDDVVGSKRAFIDAAGSRSLKAGFYKLPTKISAATAVSMLTDENDTYRVGSLVIPEGLQLDSKKGIDGKTTPGIFEMLAEATSVQADGKTYGVTVEQLQHAAAQSSVADLGVPSWAAPAVQKLTGDHRRIEGLIASGSWEDIDPRMDAKELLRSLITRSVTRFESWGLTSQNDSGLMPYDALVVASIIEREVKHDDDYAKAARVILNRLDKGQKLEMDSTANYTAAVTNIDVHGETYTDKTEWNTYQKEGLPVTPIGAVGEKALHAVEHPAVGDWVYFVTVDKDGTTLFAKTFAQHKKNTEVACKNKFITTGCS